ncbi:hypothetical protein FM120_18445 [Sphingobacterium faecium PCAi_F2.5]|nr:hypothetical protein FM120_18445 [Sphingobacterium faecium PCAi_F2.5]
MQGLCFWKSTLFKQIGSQFNIGYFVNSDDIEKELQFY